MTHQEISALVSLFDHSTALRMRLTQGDFTLELDRGTDNPASAPTSVPPSTESSPLPSPSLGKEICAPLVGTFYAAPSPDQPPYVQVGDSVKKGSTVCLIEAMKMMNEVTAPCDCVIREIIAKDGELLEFDAPIFRYEAV